MEDAKGRVGTTEETKRVVEESGGGGPADGTWTSLAERQLQIGRLVAARPGAPVIGKENRFPDVRLIRAPPPRAPRPAPPCPSILGVRRSVSYTEFPTKKSLNSVTERLLEIAFFLFRPSIETMSDRKALQSTMRWKDTSADLAATFQGR
ncbi:hypothetical protein EVAR_22046_1 [Eumeta japonica]|uniref:Uncharacterized protein n=1 Tax=Eumeta variegata TaxID=151549 RepID=A0A4C1UUE5_EUMVA|nr:hypothetical protein EVAR_22046_1 [Eumeta japonica]